MTIQRNCDELAPYFRMRHSLVTQGLVTFDTIWTLFEPGVLIYASPFMEDPQVFILESPHTVLSDMGTMRSPNTAGWPFLESSGDSSTWRSIICSGIDLDGAQLVKVFYEIRIPKFTGTRVINSLPCYPFKYFGDQHSELRKRIVDRGRLFLSAVYPTRVRTFHYSGLSLSDGSGIVNHHTRTDIVNHHTRAENSKWKLGRSRRSSQRLFQTDGPIIVDYNYYLNRGPGTAPLGNLFPWTGSHELCQCDHCNQHRSFPVWSENIDDLKALIF
ncbi:hypothetical protein GQ44DRAFT_763453, partial [Phaeosphaeriaceae sp. PMI808]